MGSIRAFIDIATSFTVTCVILSAVTGIGSYFVDAVRVDIAVIELRRAFVDIVASNLSIAGKAVVAPT